MARTNLFSEVKQDYASNYISELVKQKKRKSKSVGQFARLAAVLFLGEI
jgi:benzoyl-CoA reductase/2-hydroxyglutaryl-CoA dehydratase subunit BcrC/BadD/HgdB